MTTTVVTTMRKSRRRPRALITTAATAVAATTTTTSILGAGLLVSPVVTASDPCLMEGGTGWAATADCTQYYFCKNGVNMAGTRYSCEENHLFSVTEMHCKHSSMVHCDAAATGEAESTSSSSLQQQQQQQAQHETTTEGEGGSWQSQLYHHEIALENRTSAPTPTPAPTTPRPTKGPDIPRPKYYSDSLTSSCISTYERDPPSWIHQLYSSKSECCTVNYNWNPNCLGTDFQEITYSPSSAPTVSSMPSSKPTVTPSSYPTVHPSNTPSDIPSMGPSMSPSINPTETMSQSPSVEPSYKPTPLPTRSPLARGKTASPTLYDINQMLSVMDGMDSGRTASFNPVYGYNNGGQRPVFINKDTTSTTSSSTSFSSSSSSSLMSEIILQVVEDATISQQRPDATFGTHAALAVDAGYQGNNERFDSLLKFDLSLLDEFQEVESVTLQLYSLGNCEGGSVYTTILGSWTQDSITWDNAPSQIIDRVGSLGGLVTPNKWYDVDVTSALTSNTHYTVGSEKFITLRIDTDKNGRCMYAAVDGTDGNGAKLIVKYKSPSSATTGGGDGGMTMQSASTLPTTYPSKTGDFTILRATDDATIDLNDGSGRYGLTPTLNVAFNLNTRDVLDFLVKFDISQMRLLPTKAMFTLFAEVDCPNSGTIMVADIDGPHTQEDWSEESVSYETAPTFHVGQPSVERDLDDYSSTAADIGATFGPVTAGKWYGADVVRALTDAIRARKSSVTFRVTTSVNASPCQYSSRESGRAPKLMVEF